MYLKLSLTFEYAADNLERLKEQKPKETLDLELGLVENGILTEEEAQEGQEEDKLAVEYQTKQMILKTPADAR